jgi:Cytochrome P450
VVTFLLAGHETTAQALTWTLYLLALFSDWQERAREEIRHVPGDRLIGREPIQQLPLVEAIFSEAMPHLYALWRGSTKLHRQHLRHARRQGDARDAACQRKIRAPRS